MINNDHPHFSSDFESGNLDMVIFKCKMKYDLYMRVDSNSNGHNQWFYFRVKFNELGDYNFNICNFTKKNSLYNKGMKPYIYSKRK